MWNYWAKYSSRVPERENFCHYWRVVALWAPLRWLWNNVLGNKAAFIVVGLLALVLTGWGVANSEVVRMLVVVAYVLTGLFVGVFSAAIWIEEKDNASRLEKNLLRAGMAYGWFASWVPFAGAWITKHISSDNLEKVLLGVLITIGVVGLGFVLIGLITAVGWWTLLVPAGVLVFTGVAFGIALLADYVSGRRQQLRDAQYEAYYAALSNGVAAEYPTPKRSISKRFFSGVGDFIIFVAQVVRVKKWKICPTAEIPRDSSVV